MATNPEQNPRPGREPAPTSVEEALARAAAHGRAAVAESLSAARALLDAASIATQGHPVDEAGSFGLVARSLEELAASLSRNGPGSALLASVLEALDAEIARWETRASDDTDARAVLRAYLGVREILWEMGVRRSEPESKPRRPAARARGRGRQVQRVSVED